MAGSNFQMASSPEVLLPPVKVDTISGTLSECESNSVWKRAIVSSLAVFLLLVVVTTGIVAVAGAGPTCSVATGSGQVGRSLSSDADPWCSFNSLIVDNVATHSKFVIDESGNVVESWPDMSELKASLFKENLVNMFTLNVQPSGEKTVKVTRAYSSSSGTKSPGVLAFEEMLSKSSPQTCDGVDLAEFLATFRPKELFAGSRLTRPQFGTCFEASSMLRYIYDSPTLLDGGVEIRYEFEGGISKDQRWKASKPRRWGPYLRIVYKVQEVA